MAVVVVDLCVGIESGQGCHRRNEHPHRVRVVVEAVHELLDVLVDPRVVRDLPGPLVQGLGRRELAADEQVGDLEKGRVLGELLDRITPVPEDPFVAVDEGERATSGAGVHEGGIVGQEPRVVGPRADLPEIGSANRAVGDRHLVGLARTVVGDRQRVLIHHAPPVRLRRLYVEQLW